jgi:hypothetical protein
MWIYCAANLPAKKYQSLCTGKENKEINTDKKESCTLKDQREAKI